MNSQVAQIERRSSTRVVAFCQVLDLEYNCLGITFDLSPEGICLSLVNTFATENDFLVILSPAYTKHIPNLVMKIRPVWRRQNDSQYDEVGGKILQVWTKEIFYTLLSYYQKGGPSGLLVNF
ncbi:conserved hypothetical protein [Gloeothece citriformis PCC 7424]|uniref:PilZ domain-containing protein n=1 Tax=Gloeothece citriformis (strain PCC 7424) TaxID=65393 RepID=B7KGY0_GLOC7|nr:hypothetical protein [Gloeothece citriformis]ACK73467.1 conserved hypothetical protein [Gloeothece citriformis PCC 7424]